MTKWSLILVLLVASSANAFTEPMAVGDGWMLWPGALADQTTTTKIYRELPNRRFLFWVKAQYPSAQGQAGGLIYDTLLELEVIDCPTGRNSVALQGTFYLNGNVVQTTPSVPLENAVFTYPNPGSLSETWISKTCTGKLATQSPS